MCARLLSCPLCSQPGFVTLDSLRAGLVSVATRPLACPVCNETLLGIDKLTIHLFGHTINANNRAEHKITDINCNNSVRLVSHNGAMILPQNWNSQNTQTILSNRSRNVDVSCDDTFPPLSALIVNKDLKRLNSQCCDASQTEKSRMMFLQNSSQQEFRSPRLIKDDSMPNSCDVEAGRRNAVSMVFRSTEGNQRIASVPSKIFQNSAHASTQNPSDRESYRRNAVPMVFQSAEANERIASTSSKVCQNSAQTAMQNLSDENAYKRNAVPMVLRSTEENERVASMSLKVCQNSAQTSMQNLSDEDAYRRNAASVVFPNSEESERTASTSAKICQSSAQTSMQNLSEGEIYNRNTMPMVFRSTEDNERIAAMSSKICQNTAQISSMTNSLERNAYGRKAVPMVFETPEEEERMALISSKISQQSSAQSPGSSKAAIYQIEANEENTKSSEASAKEEAAAQFSGSWIEDLLQENGAKCSDDGASKSEAKNHDSSEKALNLQNGVEEYSEYRTSTSITSAKNELIGEPKNLLDSTDSSVCRTDEIINVNQRSSPNCKEVLPKWKAFRLLAMKDKTERCNICGTHFPDRNFLVLHKQLAHMIPEKDVNATPEELLKNCPCHLCTKVFKTRGTLMVHMRVAHMGYNLGFLSKAKESEMSCCENGFNCPTCGKNFRKEQHVTQHLKTHEGKQWECDVCSKMFTTKYFLKKHKRLHSGEMPYKCTICEKTFTFQQSYHKHRLYHKDDKPHTCATCGRSFKELSTLHNHERIHTGEKPFVCETCGKCFRQRVSYLVHRRIHTGVMPYKCTACGKSFRYKVSQRTHKCQAQPEDSSPGLAEASSPSHQQQSRRSDAVASENGILLQSQAATELAPSENNKFILIVNTHGQPILTREADVRATSNFLKEKQTSQSQSRVERDENSVDDRNLWNDRGLPTESVTEECGASPSRESNANDKQRTDEANDFFSLVMSPLENDLSSPSTEMEHLRLESPGNEETRPSESREAANSANSLQRDLNNAIDGIFRNNRSGNSPLETINEESLKQLLYGIDRKNLE